MEEIERAFQYIDDREREMKDLWIQISEIESPSYYKSGIDRIVKLLQQVCHDSGLDTRVIPFEKAGNSLVAQTKESGQNAKGITLMAHIDTVHELGIFPEPRVYEEQGFLYGPGVFDCKGGIMVAILTVKALLHAGYNKRPLKLLFSGDEEVGHQSSDGGKVIAEELKGSALVFNCESGPLNGQLAVGRKSAGGFKIHIQGIGAHSGGNPEKGRSAILEAAHKIIELEKLTDIKGTGTVVNCGVIAGGTVINAIPEECVVNVNLRFQKEEEIQAVLDKIAEIAETSYIDGTYSQIVDLKRPEKPMIPDQNNQKAYEAFANAAKELGFENNEPCFAGGGSDAVIAYRLGIPVLCQTGVRGEDHHTLRERAQTASLTQRAKILVKSILDLSDAF